jgi:hypothetical protein
VKEGKEKHIEEDVTDMNGFGLELLVKAPVNNILELKSTESLPCEH